jgi:hypothetical protein
LWKPDGDIGALGEETTALAYCVPPFGICAGMNVFVYDTRAHLGDLNFFV